MGDGISKVGDRRKGAGQGCPLMCGRWNFKGRGPEEGGGAGVDSGVLLMYSANVWAVDLQG